jgi:hypothetical protein
LGVNSIRELITCSGNQILINLKEIVRLLKFEYDHNYKVIQTRLEEFKNNFINIEERLVNSKHDLHAIEEV